MKVLGGVENRRTGGSLSRWLVGLAFAWPPQSGLAWPCFLFPLIEPDVRSYRIRLSEKTHAFARGNLGMSIDSVVGFTDWSQTEVVRPSGHHPVEFPYQCR